MCVNLVNVCLDYNAFTLSMGVTSDWDEKSTWIQTDMREGKQGGEEKVEWERGGTIGGTYCQVGPRGVARVAPLSDSTHKREVGKTLAVGIEIGRNGRQKKRLKNDKAGVILYFFYIAHKSNKNPKPIKNWQSSCSAAED